MKVVVVHNHPIHYKQLLFEELSRAGLNLDVVFMARGSSVRREVPEARSDVFESHFLWDGSYETAPLSRKTIGTWKELRKVAPDVVIISGYYSSECWSAWAWAIVHRKPIIMWFESNEFDWRRFWLRELPKRLFCRALSRANVYGTTSREYLMKLGLSSDRIDIKRAVVDVEAFVRGEHKRDESPRTRKQLLYVGRLAPEKNVGLVLRALAALSPAVAAQLSLVIAGSGPLEQELRSETLALGISAMVTFLGYVPHRELPQLYQSADFFILPSTREPWGLVALEAMLARLPILVSTACGCARDVVTAGNGWTFSPDAPSELVSLLTLLPTLTKEQRTTMGQVSAEIAGEYSAANCAEIVMASIRKAVAEARSGKKTSVVLNDRKESSTIALLFVNFGPYHIARLTALRAIAKVDAIEYAMEQGLYGWIVDKSKLQLLTLQDSALEDRTPWWFAKSLLRLWRYLARVRPTSILIPGYADTLSVTAALWGRFNGTRNVLMFESTEGDFPRYRFKEAVKSVLVRMLYDTALVGGIRSADYLKRLGMPADRVFKKYDIIDNHCFEEGVRTLRADSDRRDWQLPQDYFVIVARLSPEKNLSAVLNAFHMYRALGGRWDLVIVGRGPQMAELLSITKDLGEEETVRFVGFKNGPELLPYYAFANCFILNSIREPWGLVVNEAMASGLPVIVSSACGCVPELVKEGQNGYIVDPESCNSLVEAMHRMEHLPVDVRNRMAAASSAIIEEFSPSDWASGAHYACSTELVPVRS